MRFPSVKIAVVGLAVIGTVAFAACGGGDDDGDATAAATETTAATAAATETAGGGDDGVLFGGKTAQEFYTLNCSACHGADRQVITGLGLPLTPDVLTESDDFYRDTITNGRAGTVMPAWSDTGLSTAEIDALVQFIRTAP
ncbi:MAG: cytochrome c [Chloroflexi bacterium]|nr:cytochrome c [Chloroflexota bacterium]MDA1146131.1 cytochrome c [Chloroflexota bacterium]